MTDSPLIARDDLLSELRARLDDGEHRLALVGPAGVGKSRLARELLASLSRAGRRGHFVDLRGARPDELAPRVGRALGLDVTGVDAVADVLAVRDDAILVLDNLESAADAGALRVISEAAPELTLLLTSQHAPPDGFLRVKVPPLDEADAARLLETLVEDARGAPLSDEERASARALAARLDGLPLALELAAARAELLPLAEIDRRAQSAAPKMLGPLEAALEASWSLLSDEEKRALTQLTRFSRGFSLDAAEALLGVDAIDLLQALSRKSLLVVALRDGGTVFSLLDAVRRFAAARLGDEDRAGADARLADWLLTPVAAQDPLDYDEDARRLLDALAASDPTRATHVGLRCATAASARGSSRELLALCDALVEVAARTGSPELLARVRTRRAAALLDNGATDEAGDAARPVADDDTLPGALRAEAYLALADARGAGGRTDEAMEAARAALEVTDAPSSRGKAHHLLFILPIVRGGDAGELSHMSEAIRLLREADDEEFLTRALTNFGFWHLKTGDHDQAERYLDEALTRARASGERRRLPYFLGNLVLLRLDQRRYSEALRLAEEACELAEVHVADSLVNLRHGERGIALAFLGRVTGARRAFLRAAEPARGRDAARADALFSAWRAALDAREPGRAEDARRRASDALSRAEALGRADVVEAVALLARAAERGEDVEHARAHESTHDAHVRLAARFLAGRAAPAAEVASGERRLVVDDEQRRVQLDAAVIDLVHRGRLWLVLRALLDARVQTPGAPRDIAQLFEAGWPGQTIQHEAMRNRVYNAVSTLRSLGLGEVLLSLDGGYLLDPQLHVEG